VLDPVAHAINCMLDHMHAVDRRMKSLSDALKRSGIDANLEVPDLDVENLDSDGENDSGKR